MGAAPTPEHVPEPIATAFREGAVSVVVGNWNAAGTMFRLAIDLATRSMLPEEDVEGLNKKARRDLGLRLPWLFDHGLLPMIYASCPVAFTKTAMMVHTRSRLAGPTPLTC
jgi:hypothetical protein